MNLQKHNCFALDSLLDSKFVGEICDIAKQAGQAINDVYEKDFAIESKKDQSPLTEADLASHRLIVAQLRALTPEIPILSEEAADIDWQERRQWQTYWLIDPLDGTKEFIKRNGEFTVNIALIHRGEPVLGVVYAPVLDCLYYASQRIGAWKQEKEHQALKIQVAGEPLNRAYNIMGSRSHPSEEFKAYVEQFASTEIISMGSSLKLCHVAEGKADLYPRLGPTSEWDTAAAHAVVLMAGGQCLDYETNKALKYNTKDSLLNPHFVVKGY